MQRTPVAQCTTAGRGDMRIANAALSSRRAQARYHPIEVVLLNWHGKCNVLNVATQGRHRAGPSSATSPSVQHLRPAAMHAFSVIGGSAGSLLVFPKNTNDVSRFVCRRRLGA